MEIMSKAEVPGMLMPSCLTWESPCLNYNLSNDNLGWREVDISSTDEVADLEVTDDDAYAKRHLKYELDEKKRKKWDLQRMKEQRHMERLRAR